MRISGHVTSDNGEPLEWATVVFVSGPVDLPDIGAVTSDDGAFAMTAPAPGRYWLGFRADDHDERDIDVEVGPADVSVAVELFRSART